MLSNPIKNKTFKEGFVNLVSQPLALILLVFVLGILLYFCSVPASIIYTFSAIALTGIFFVRQKPFLLWILILIVTTGVGFFRIDYRTRNLNHITLDRTLYHTIIQADIIQNITLPEKQILTLYPTHWPLGDFTHPELIRLNYYNKEPILKSGDHIRLRAHIMPPTKAYSNHKTFYEKIGAIGKAEEILSTQKTEQSPNFFEKLRYKITNRLFELLPTNQARIATPLITGEQHFVSNIQYQNYRRSGIAHVLSVSGFHMALLAAFLFFLVRGFCVLSKLTLYINAKKIAAIIALIGTSFYLALSSFQIPALRSFGMIALVFLGILTDRKAFSIHSLVLVGLAMLLYEPEMVLSVSFQLSFLSVLILISVHEKFKNFHPEMNKNIHKFLEFVLMNIVLSIGLIPVVAYHFHQITPLWIFRKYIIQLYFFACDYAIVICGMSINAIGIRYLFFQNFRFLIGNN